jgi:pimeloyl-ACP methyl ester carboxylesterase
MAIQNVLIACISALVLSSRVSAQRVEAPRRAGDTISERVTLTIGDTGKLEFELGTIFVPEVRGKPGSRLIGVGFARFRHTGTSTAPPVFYLPGGPGQSYVSSLKQDRGLASWLRIITLDRYRSVGDVIFIDQRGFSERGDVLKYRYRTPARSLDSAAAIERYTESFVGMAREAIAEYERRKIDLRGYTVTELADDVNDLRAALGYDRITLVGTSFGTQLSLAVMRRHPAIVARALLSGVEPLNNGYDMPGDVLAAHERIWAAAKSYPRLQPYMPTGGFAEVVRTLMQRFAEQAVVVTIKEEGAADSVRVRLGVQDLQRALHTIDETSGPAFILSLYHRQYDAWARRVAAERRARDVDYTMILPLIDVSLGITPAREKILRADKGEELFGRWAYENLFATKTIWPTADVGDAFRMPARSDIPVVFAQGDWDVATPVENASELAPFFPKGKLLVVEHGDHGVLEPLARDAPDVFTALIEFLRTGSVEGVPAKAILPYNFSLPAFPPPAERR